MTTLTVSSLALLGGVLPLLAISAGCGGKQTTASKSAAAYDEAQRRGAAPTGGAHGGHASVEASPMAAGSHPMPEHGTGAAAPAAGVSPSSMDHSKMSGIDHAKAPPGSGAAMAGMDHAKMAARPQGRMPPPQPEHASTTAKPGQPAATLGPDDIDAPVPTSVYDAARSAALAQEMYGGQGMQHGTYRQIDAGRASVAPTKPEESHESHAAAPRTQASPKADPHSTHSAPAATPAPSRPPAAMPERKPPPRPQPSPSPDPHQLHAAPASPRPSPTPGAKDASR